MSANFYDVARQRFGDRLSRTCIETQDGRRFSFADLERQTARYANAFSALALKKGDRVAVQVEKSPHALFVYLACLRAGLVYLPLNTAYRESELNFFLRDAAPGLVICDPQLIDRIQAAAETPNLDKIHTLDPDGNGTWAAFAETSPDRFPEVSVNAEDPAAMLYTSGTTGRPKGAVLSHENLVSNAVALHQAWGWSDGDVLLHTLPLFHVHGLFVACHCALLNASTMLFLSKFDVAAVINLLPRATVFMGVPTFYSRLLAAPEFTKQVCRAIRLFVSGSAPLLPQLFDEFKQRTGHAILERYGMTETGMNLSNPLNGPRIAGTVGTPLPGVSIRIVDESNGDVATGEVGQLLVRGANVFKGYWRMPEKSAEDFTSDGYFKTGDLARIDANAYVAIVGRAKDLVISGGYNVYPKEVESFLDGLDGIVESAVIGLPHPDFGEAVVAVAVREPGREDLTELNVIQSLKESIAGFKVPKRVVFVDELPRNTMGKIQKNSLRRQFADLLNTDSLAMPRTQPPAASPARKAE